MKTMKCVVKTAPGDGHLALETREIPQIGEINILVKVRAAAVCGTDIHIQRWNDWAAKRVKPPSIIGHEFAGEVIKVGSAVTAVKPGDIVSAETHIVCHGCEFCRTGKEHVCPNNKSIGVQRDGCFAEYIAIPEDVAFVCDPSLPVEVGSILEPFGVAVHAVMEFPVSGKSVAISGCGPIGLMGLLVAKKVGAARIIAIEPNASRAKMAMELGADAVIDPTEVDAVDAVREKSGGYGVDVALEFSGSISALRAASLFTKPGGALAVVGLPSKPLEFDIAEFAYKGITLKGIAGRKMYETWYQVRGFLDSGIDLSRIVTHKLPFEDYEKALRLMETGECCKCVLMINE